MKSYNLTFCYFLLYLLFSDFMFCIVWYFACMSGTLNFGHLNEEYIMMNGDFVCIFKYS